MKHIKLFHSHQPGFTITCGIGGCQRSFTKFRTFQNHISALHRHQEALSNTTTFDTPSADGVVDIDDDYQGFGEDDNVASMEERGEVVDCHAMLQKNSALFLMGLKEEHKLTQGAVMGVVEGITSLAQQRLGVLRSKVHVHVDGYITNVFVSVQLHLLLLKLILRYTMY